MAYAEIGDFDSAIRYAEQALAIKGIPPATSKKRRIYAPLRVFEIPVAQIRLRLFQELYRIPVSVRTSINVNGYACARSDNRD
jgi:hypothetical protein